MGKNGGKEVKSRTKRLSERRGGSQQEEKILDISMIFE